MPRRPLLVALLVTLVSSVAWVGVASVPGLGPSGCLAGCADGRERLVGPLRVVSFNMLHDFPSYARLEERIDHIVEGLRAVDADVVLLQEVPWTPALGSVAERLADGTGMNHVWLRANGNRRAVLFEEGEVILSRFPMRDPAGLTLPEDAEFFQHRIALAATVETPWGPVRVVSAHLSGEPPAASSAQVAAVGDFAAAGAAAGGLPIVVGGDFNATDDQQPIQVLAARPGWVDLLRAATPGDSVAFTCCHDDLTLPPDAPMTERIDYLWSVSGSGTLLLAGQVGRIFDVPFSTDAGWLWASDHVGIYAELEVVGG